jgi:TonB family protein
LVTPKKKPSVSPSPKSSPKKSASASPKPSSKHSASPSASATPKPAKPDEGDTGSDNPSKSDQTGEGKVVNSGTPGPKGNAGTRPGEGGGDRGGKGAKNGAEEAAKVNWYLNMLHDRFYSGWVEPASLLQNGESLVTTIKIRIEKDGHISNVTLEKSSGNPIMDESVMMAAKRIQHVDPLPESIKDSFYDVPIDIELTPH